MGLLERLRSEDEEADTQIAHEVLERIEDEARRHISPTRVIFASMTVILLLIATLFVLTWIVPYDRVSGDVVYRQGGPGHVVLIELDNDGSRTIEDIDLQVRFIDSEGIEISRSSFLRDYLPAHSSVSGDDMELLVDGASVWENYTIEILLYYDSYSGQRSERWTHNVGGWTVEIFADKSQYRFL